MTETAIAFLGLIVGLVVGWFGHRRVWTWCAGCGCVIGTSCNDCRNLERSNDPEADRCLRLASYGRPAVTPALRRHAAKARRERLEIFKEAGLDSDVLDLADDNAYAHLVVSE
jgi:hypothetical protein